MDSLQHNDAALHTRYILAQVRAIAEALETTISEIIDLTTRVSANQNIHARTCNVCGMSLAADSNLFNPIGLHWVCAACNTAFQEMLEKWLRSRQVSGVSAHELR